MSDDLLDEGGQDLHGAVATLGKLAEQTLAEQVTEEPDDEREPEDVTPDASDDAPELDEAEDQHAAPEEDEGESDDEPQADDDELPSSLSDLADALEVDESYINGLIITRKVDGEDHTVTLGEVLSGVGQQKQVSEIEAEKRTLNEQRQALEAEKTQQAEQIQALLANLDSLVAQDEPENLDELADEDPVAYIQAVQKAQKRKESVEKAKQEAQLLLGKQQQEQMEKFQAFAAEEAQRFRARHSDLADDEKFKAEMTDVVAFLQSQGFSNDEIKATVDSRIWGVALQAMRFERAAKKAPDTRKKVKKLPKVLRSGSTEGKKAAGTERLAKARSRLKKTGTVDDAVSLMKQLAS